MRIIAGRLRRRHLKAPPGGEVRPTSDRVREALFNIVESRRSFEEAEILDLFAGTGALGLEALSRGAASVTFVERSGRVMDVLRENADALGVSEACSYLTDDAIRFLRGRGGGEGAEFDVIFADPPYDLPGLPTLPSIAIPLLKRGGFLILEHDQRHRFGDHPAFLIDRKYGRTTVTIFENRAQD